MCSCCKTSPSEYVCNECTHRNHAIHYCSQCYDTSHSRDPYQEHEKISINDQSLKRIFCPKHPDERLKRWCDKCHIPVCNECLLIEHSGHSYHSINDGFKELEKQVSNSSR